MCILAFSDGKINLREERKGQKNTCRCVTIFLAGGVTDQCMSWDQRDGVRKVVGFRDAPKLERKSNDLNN